MFCFSFSKTQLAMQLPAEKQEKRELPHRLTVAFHDCLHRGADGRTDVRTYVRRTDSDVITKPKFLAFTGYQILSAMGLRSRAPCGARGSSAIKSLKLHYALRDLTSQLICLSESRGQYPAGCLTISIFFFFF